MTASWEIAQLQQRLSRIRHLLSPQKTCVVRENKLLRIALLLLPVWGFAQINTNAQFGCRQNQRASLEQRPDLHFVAVGTPDVVKHWKTRPVLAFDGFDAVKYGFTRAEFYRWHLPVPGREDFDGTNTSKDRLALAVRVVASGGERWFELANPENEGEDQLYIQPRDESDTSEHPEDTVEQHGSGPKPDEMAGWISIQLATPDAGLPLFILKYQHRDLEVYSASSLENKLLVDLRTSTPQVVEAASCKSFESIGGACSGRDEANEGHDTLQCQWEAKASDFHCTMTTPYGSLYAARTAQADFYLLSDKPANPSSHDPADFVADLRDFAFLIRNNNTNRTEGVLVSGLGPTTLLAHFKDLLPQTDVLVFASPGAGDMLNAHLSLVTLHQDGKFDMQAIPKWGIAGDETDEYKTNEHKDAVPISAGDLYGSESYVPIDADDAYQTHVLEQRPGFRAFDVVLTVESGKSSPVHVIYWVGLEAVDGKLVANAVRLAGESWVYGGCGQEYREGTARFIRRKAGLAEATVGVQGRYNPESSTAFPPDYPTEGPNCVWTDLLHWKAGAGFRVRKLAEDCKALHQEVKISDDGFISAGSSH